MKAGKFDLGQTIQLLANIGVLGGIVFLAYELRQMNQTSRLDAAENHTQRANMIDSYIVEDPRLTGDIDREDPDFRDLTTQRVFLNRMRFRDWEVTFFSIRKAF